MTTTWTMCVVVLLFIHVLAFPVLSSAGMQNNERSASDLLEFLVCRTKAVGYMHVTPQVLRQSPDDVLAGNIAASGPLLQTS